MMYSVIRQSLLVALIAGLPVFAAVDMKQSVNQVDVAVDGKPLTTLHFGTEINGIPAMKPYLAPLWSVSGKVVTRSWPMEASQGETKDHPHHTGLWYTHGDVNGIDFWANVKPGPKFGQVKVEKVTSKGGKKSGEIVFDANWNGPDGKTLLQEKRKMVFHEDPVNRVIDFDITLTAQDQAVKFGDTKEGTFAIRLNDKLAEKGGTGVLVNAEGARGMKDVWGKPSPWVDYSGTLEGEALGIAILDHPENPKHPTTWHARDYGLFAVNPFGDHDFYRDPNKDGSLTIQPGKSLRFRYRVIIHPGDAAAANIAELYKAWK